MLREDLIRQLAEIRKIIDTQDQVMFQVSQILYNLETELEIEARTKP
jgi:hypothetical protein